VLDSPSGRPHWWRGWRAGASAERYDVPIEAFALHSASTPTQAFTRLSYEGEVGVSFWRDPRTLRLLGRVVDERGKPNGGNFLITDYTVQGGSEGMWGFEPGRFHDLDQALVRLTDIYPIARYFEGDLHSEAGTVSPQLSDIRIDQLKHSFGVAVRVRAAWGPLAFGGLDWSSERLRWRFGFGAVE